MAARWNLRAFAIIIVAFALAGCGAAKPATPSTAPTPIPDPETVLTANSFKLVNQGSGCGIWQYQHDDDYPNFHTVFAICGDIRTTGHVEVRYQDITVWSDLGPMQGVLVALYPPAIAQAAMTNASDSVSAIGLGVAQHPPVTIDHYTVWVWGNNHYLEVDVAPQSAGWTPQP